MLRHHHSLAPTHNDLQDLARVDDLLAQLGALALPSQTQQVGEDSEADEVVEADELSSRECGQGVEEELTATLEVTNREEVKAFVDLEAITTVPVAALLDEAVCERERKREQ